MTRLGIATKRRWSGGFQEGQSLGQRGRLDAFGPVVRREWRGGAGEVSAFVSQTHVLSHAPGVGGLGPDQGGSILRSKLQREEISG